MTIFDIPVKTLAGQDSSLGSLEGKTLLVVNVASKCGLTPQYAALEKLHTQFASRGFAVVGFPCNQFGGQEPGTAEEIAEFCSATYGVTFPMFEKVEVNGSARHPVYTELTAVPDANGEAGDIQWNFEKFLISPTGDVVGRSDVQVIASQRCLARGGVGARELHQCEDAARDLDRLRRSRSMDEAHALADPGHSRGVIDERRKIQNSRPAIFHRGDSRKHVLGRLHCGVFLDLPPALSGRARFSIGDENLRIQMRIPDVQGAHPGIFPHVLAIGAYRRAHRIRAMPLAEAEFASGQHDARSEPLHVPFPRRGKRLVEIVDVEYQQAFRASEAAEIRYVTITAGLNSKPCGGRRCEIRSHQSRGAAEKCEGRLPHAGVADRQKFREPSAVGMLQQLNTIGAPWGRLPLRLRGSWHALAQGFSAGHALLGARAGLARFRAARSMWAFRHGI